METEWQTVKITSSYNAYLDADACCIQPMANAAFYQHFPLKEKHFYFFLAYIFTNYRYIQNPEPSYSNLIKFGYVKNGKVVPKMYFMFYVGDYDR